jgi:hypothetical protein
MPLLFNSLLRGDVADEGALVIRHFAQPVVYIIGFSSSTERPHSHDRQVRDSGIFIDLDCREP